MVELKSLKDWDAKVGDIFVYHAGNSHEPSDVPVTVVKYDGKKYCTKEVDDGTLVSLTSEPYWSLVKGLKKLLTRNLMGTLKWVATTTSHSKTGLR